VQLWEERLYRGELPTKELDERRDAELSQLLDAFIEEERAYTPIDTAAEHVASQYGFRKDAEASLNIHERKRMCPALEHNIGEPMDPRRNILFIIGTQKGGTTFLFNALKKHPAFVGANHAYGFAPTPCMLLSGCSCIAHAVRDIFVR
jgi:hypothetical protein